MLIQESFFGDNREDKRTKRIQVETSYAENPGLI